MLEVGAWKGCSTAALARQARRVVSVDWHRGDEGSGNEWTLPEYASSLTALGLWGVVVPVVGRFEDVAPFLAPASFGLVWVDGAHDEESVSRDTGHALNLISPGGMVAWHDWNYQSVRAGVARHLKLEDVRLRVGAIATWQKEVGA